jgi:uncharacterized protein (TIGR00290 family)
MLPVFVSWSGGKDSCLAGYRAMHQGLEVRYLANTVSEDGQRSCSHGIAADVIRRQAEAIGMPIVQRRTTGEAYEAEFIEMLRAFKGEGINGGVFGDIDFNPHREWIERVCRQAGMTAHLPLWGESQHKLLEEFIDLGFRTIIVAAKAEFFGEEVLGRTVDRGFISYLAELNKLKPITPCGEAGEYHTLVVDGPIFKRSLELLETRKVTRDGIHFLDILSMALKNKP